MDHLTRCKNLYENCFEFRYCARLAMLQSKGEYLEFTNDSNDLYAKLGREFGTEYPELVEALVESNKEEVFS